MTSEEDARSNIHRVRSAFWLIENRSQILRDIARRRDSLREPPDESNGAYQYAINKFQGEVEFVVTCIGYSVGLGNLWRFPYYASRNGGGAFLLAYVVLTIFVTYPLIYMELFLGQFSKLGPLGVWSSCPFFKGVGVSIMAGCSIVLVYYNVLMSYGLFYAAQVFREKLPWADCEEWWGADKFCYRIVNYTMMCKWDPNCNISFHQSSADQFWTKYVLGLSSGFDDVGTIKWDQALCLLVTWIFITLLALYRHHSKVHFKFKAVYVTAFFPFVILIIYLVYALTMPGAFDGLRHLFVPEWKRLSELRVWGEALQMNIYSLGIGAGAMILFGSKNEDNYDIRTCAAITCFCDFLASVLTTSVTFCLTGFMALTMKKPSSELPEEHEIVGEGLVFVTYPNAVLNMSMKHLWAFLFFTMFIILSTDASVGMLETVCVVLNTLLFETSAGGNMKLKLVLVSSILFLAGLGCVTNAGAFIIAILDEFGGGLAVLGIVMCEAIAFGWGYGIARVSADLEKLRGYPTPLVAKICWVFFIPTTLIALFVLSLSNLKLQRQYNVPYPDQAEILAWAILIIVLGPVPVWMIINLSLNREDVSKCFKPEEIWLEAVRHYDQET